MIILTFLLYLFLFIISLILLLFILPIEYFLEGYKYDSTKLVANISILAGIIKFNISITNFHIIKGVIYFAHIPFPIDIEDSIETKKSKIGNFNLNESTTSNKKDNQMKKTNKDKYKEALEYLNKDFLELVLSFLYKFFNKIKPHYLRIDAYYGFDDPFNTAMCCAFLSSLNGLLKEYPVSLYPNFTDTILEGEIRVQGRIRIIVLLYLVLSFVLTKPVRNIIKNIIRFKKEEKSYAK